MLASIHGFEPIKVSRSFYGSSTLKLPFFFGWSDFSCMVDYSWLFYRSMCMRDAVHVAQLEVLELVGVLTAMEKHFNRSPYCFFSFCYGVMYVLSSQLLSQLAHIHASQWHKSPSPISGAKREMRHVPCLYERWLEWEALWLSEWLYHDSWLIVLVKTSTRIMTTWKWTSICVVFSLNTKGNTLWKEKF